MFDSSKLNGDMSFYCDTYWSANDVNASVLCMILANALILFRVLGCPFSVKNVIVDPLYLTHSETPKF